MKNYLSRRITRPTHPPLDEVLGNNDGDSLGSTTESSLRSREDGDVWAGAATAEYQHLPRPRKGKKVGVGHPTKPRFSKLAASVVIPRPEQHTGLTAADVGGDVGGGGGHCSKIAQTSPSSHMSSKKGKGRAPSAATGATAPVSSARASGKLGYGSTIRLDVVRADTERAGGTSVSPQKGVSAGAKSGGVSQGSAGAAGLARSDSTARELLKWYSDEQVIHARVRRRLETRTKRAKYIIGSVRASCQQSEYRKSTRGNIENPTENRLAPYCCYWPVQWCVVILSKALLQNVRSMLPDFCLVATPPLLPPSTRPPFLTHRKKCSRRSGWIKGQPEKREKHVRRCVKGFGRTLYVAFCSCFSRLAR